MNGQEYVVLARYVGNGSKVWWESSKDTWKVGYRYLLPGTEAEVIIVKLIPIGEK